MTTETEKTGKRSVRRICFDCDEDLFRNVYAFRHEARHKTLSDAYMELWRAGLRALKGGGSDGYVKRDREAE